LKLLAAQVQTAIRHAQLGSLFETKAQFRKPIPSCDAYSAELECFLTRLVCSIKDGSLLCEFLLQKMMKPWRGSSGRAWKASNLYPQPSLATMKRSSSILISQNSMASPYCAS